MSDTVRIVTANLNKDRPGDRDYRRRLRGLAGRPSATIFQEFGHGIRSTRIHSSGLIITPRRRLTLGEIGTHRGVAHQVALIGWQRVHVFSVHGLHVATAGKPAQDAYFAALKQTTDELTGSGTPWILGGDFNRGIIQLARYLGGTAYGTGIGGFITSGVDVDLSGVDHCGMARGWTDHPAYWIEVKRKHLKGRK